MGNLLHTVFGTFLLVSTAGSDKLNAEHLLHLITFLILFRSSACNIALKLLASKLDKLSYRYSKVIHIGGYFGE